MSGVVLRTVWLNLAADPAQAMAFPFMSSLSVNTEQQGEVRQLANGRRRVVRRAGKGRSVELSLPNCTREQVAWLEDRLGQTMCIRDDRGRKLFGAYFALAVSEHRYNSEADVSVTCSEVSHSVAV
jgi:predicted 3-demethylubiquinone-9 3-methyltransferase (glyoxalase superfamily)